MAEPLEASPAKPAVADAPAGQAEAHARMALQRAMRKYRGLFIPNGTRRRQPTQQLVRADRTDQPDRLRKMLIAPPRPEKAESPN
jgi:hypothetical protein